MNSGYLAQLMRKSRKDLGYTVDAMAEMLGISVETYKKVETKTGLKILENAIEAMHILGISNSELDRALHSDEIYLLSVSIEKADAVIFFSCLVDEYKRNLKLLEFPDKIKEYGLYFSKNVNKEDLEYELETAEFRLWQIENTYEESSLDDKIDINITMSYWELENLRNIYSHPIPESCFTHIDAHVISKRSYDPYLGFKGDDLNHSKNSRKGIQNFFRAFSGRGFETDAEGFEKVSWDLEDD